MRASIDLGSNSALCVVVDADGNVVLDRCEVVGLGRGLGDGGTFRPDREQAALDALADFAEAARVLGVEPGEVVAVATSASRRATNAEAFFRRVEERTGLVFRILSGEEEALATFRGALSGVQTAGESVVIDLGGGSTEFARGGTSLVWAHSYEVGSVRLTERFLGSSVRIADDRDLEAMREHVRAVFVDPFCDCAPDQVVGVAGTVTSLMACAMGLDSFDADAIHGRLLTDDVLASFETRSIGADAQARRHLFHGSPERADYLLAGCVVLRECLRRCGAESLVVSVRGLRYGVLTG